MTRWCVSRQIAIMSSATFSLDYWAWRASSLGVVWHLWPTCDVRNIKIEPLGITVPNGPRMLCGNSNWNLDFCDFFGTAKVGQRKRDGKIYGHGMVIIKFMAKRRPCGLNSWAKICLALIKSGHGRLMFWIFMATEINGRGISSIKLDSKMIQSAVKMLSEPQLHNNGIWLPRLARPKQRENSNYVMIELLYFFPANSNHLFAGRFNGRGRRNLLKLILCWF